MDISNYIHEQGLSIIPLLYIIGSMIKKAKFIDDRYIPLILLAAGILFAFGLMGFSVTSAIQGVLLAGTAVFGNQVVKQFSASA